MGSQDFKVSKEKQPWLAAGCPSNGDSIARKGDVTEENLNDDGDKDKNSAANKPDIWNFIY